MQAERGEVFDFKLCTLLAGNIQTKRVFLTTLISTVYEHPIPWLCFNIDILTITICTLKFVRHIPVLLLFKRPSQVSYSMLSNSLCCMRASAVITSLDGYQECPACLPPGAADRLLAMT